MNNGARISLAVGAGYLLGRRRKLRKALVLAAAVAAGRASHTSGGLLNAGSKLLHSSPQLSNLGRLGGPLVSASKAAANAAAGSGIDAVGGKLRGSADALRRKGGGAGQRNEGGGTEQRNEGGAGQRNEGDQESGDDRPEGAGTDDEQRGR
ncbi:hypothetical protein ACTMSW_14570 [Micromonospora sp. BQ11]|uniref:hypothetical protein n=1 Tax=Micromonospora sp. BQ11 TaxID=3452212 RepID=UPI003F893539